MFIFLSLSNAKDFKIYAVVWSIITAIWSISSLILHYNYYEQAKDLTIIEHEEFFEFFKEKQTKIYIYKKDTISLDLYMSATMVDSNFPSGKLSTEEYCYAVIKTNTDNVVVNNLIYVDVKHLPFRFPEVKTTYHKTGFAII